MRRMPERGEYRWATVEAILDEAFWCHVGFVVEGQPVVLPMAYGRVGRTLYLHGAPANRLLKTLAGGCEACVTVTLVDGLVLSRSQFHHSLNYRSVVAFGRATSVEDDRERRVGLEAVVDHVVPGRSADAREPSAAEQRATRLVAFSIEEASAKVRQGPPKEEPEDLALAVWGGVVPLRNAAGAPLDDGRWAGPGEPPSVPAYLRPYQRPAPQPR